MTEDARKGGSAAGLTLSMQASPRPGGGGAGTLSAYDHTAGEWRELSGALGSVRFPNPVDYMSPDGRVLVKIEASPDGLDIQEARLTAEVTAF